MDELKPCPFCGGDRVKVTKPTMWQAWCMDCKAIGAARLTEQEAAEAWNTRASGWIPCSERLPDFSETVLVAYKGYDGELVYAVSERFKLTGKEDVKWSAIAGNTPSHWMPLPEPPGMEDNDG